KEGISEETYYDLFDDMKQQKVDIYLPSFNVTTPQYKLRNMLMNLGIQDAFTNKANFSGITKSPDLFIKHVLHKGFISVNEEGTEAAAATGVVMNFKSASEEEPEQIQFDCDHPFLYLIQHEETGTILFMGTMNNPTL
ncbi:MAG: serpin family protein, partial [Candidatus Thermoplasmatota archaeon]|nr:serpin family protein [Candidatus Thermoplasmatota archaeon]